MKRFLSFALLFIVFMTSIQAQRQVKATEDFATYKRNSISIITVKYNDQYDEIFTTAIDNAYKNSKFDNNNINTKSIYINGLKRITPNNVSISPLDPSAYSGNNLKGMNGTGLLSMVNITPDKMTTDAITQYLNEHNVGKEIFSHVLSRGDDGRFSRELIDQRAMWNATDRDVAESKMTQVNTLGQNGENLLKNSYIIVFDMKNPCKSITETRDSYGKIVRDINWKANVSAFVYRISNAQSVIDDILQNMWIYEYDEEQVRAEKRTAFDNLQVKMELVSSVTLAESEDHLDEALTRSYGDMLHAMEKKIMSWETTIDCETVRPYITAKIGNKEGVTNGQRFALYVQKYNNKTQDVEFVRQGYVRATEVADNNKVADGNAPCSYFYKIAGASKLKGTEILKQSNDHKMGICIGYNFNGNSLEPVESPTFGAFSMINVTMDFLISIKKSGTSHYLLLDIGYDNYTGSRIAKGHNFGTYDNKNKLFDNGVGYLNVSIGYMLGLKIKHVIEFQPFIKIGADYILPYNSFNESTMTELAAAEKKDIIFTKDNYNKRLGFLLDPGMRITINLYYPVQLYVQANYSIGLGGSSSYTVLNDYLVDSRCGHKAGVGVGGGLKFNF